MHIVSQFGFIDSSYSSFVSDNTSDENVFEKDVRHFESVTKDQFYCWIGNYVARSSNKCRIEPLIVLRFRNVIF